MPVENGTKLGNGRNPTDESGGSKSFGGNPEGPGEGDNPLTLQQQPTDEVAADKEQHINVTSLMNGKFTTGPENGSSPNLKDSPATKKTDGSASFLRAARAGNLEKVLEFLKTNTDINTCNANGLNALHLSSKEGHTNVVAALLERNANVDSATKKGNTALHIASLAGQDEIVKVLVEHGATVNIQSQNGFTPLYMAAQENHDSVVKFLLSHGANQSLATEDGFTPLAVALQQGHDRVVSVLLENDTRGKVRLPALHIAAKKDDAKAAALLLHTDHNPDITSKSGFTPLHIASHYGNDNIAGLLIQRGADVNYVAKHQITPLHVASKWGKGNMVSLLVDKGANIEAKTRDGLTPLHCAARSGHETVVDMLLEKGAPITAKTKNGLAPLHMSSQGDHVDAARILLYHKAPVDDVTVDFLTALHVAAHCGHVRVAKLLLDRKADPNSRALNGFTPLHIACKKNRIKVVELLLKHGASIEATTESGLTPLHVASFMGCMNIVIYLIQHGASADVPTVRGESPLHLAARANQTDIIRILLRNGAEVDAKAREQQTALHIASRLGNTDIVGLLLQQGASVDAPTKDLYTPLHIAAKEGQEEVAGVLLDHGASLNTTTKKGFTPLHLAAKYGHLKVARLLLQRDAPVDPKGKNGVTPLHVAAHYDNQNVAMLLLDKGAQPHATAKNGYTPLHIAARKNQMDIAGTLLEYGANANAESKAGFTPLHLSAQEGHADMATLLLEHGAQSGGAAKNGLTPLHLCAQEDRVPVGAILVKHGAAVDAQTKAGYTPLHVAAHFGQMNMVRFLLQHGTKVDAPTQLGYTPLHQAAQQGHTQIVNLLLENKAQPNMETNDGKTALSIAQRLGYISVVETLKIVTETRVQTNTTTTTEEKYKVVVPETMHETFMSESEDEGADDTMLGDQSYRYLTVDEMKSLGDDSLPIDVTRDEKMDVSFQSNIVGSVPGDHISPQHRKDLYQSYPTDNIDVAKAPILAGPESLNTTMNTTFNPPEDDSLIVNDESCTEVPAQGVTQSSPFPATVTRKETHGEEGTNIWDQFLVSFMVDARGGAMRGCRHSGVRVIIPPRKAAMPMRITCRYLKKDKLVHAPPLMEGEALSSRILEMGPSAAKFLGPVIIEVPHFASLRGKEREIVILRSDNGETWREHTLEATEEAVQEVLNESFDGEELKQLEDLNTNRITRILTTDFPQYFAIVTRIRQEVHAIGPEGGMVSSTVVPQVQAVFPQGALTKKIKVGLQAQPISTDLVSKLLGNRVAVSPIVTVEPRRRKFHKPITLTIPVPQAASKGMINQYSGEAPTLRLLCSITGGTTRAQWEDVTGSTPLTFVNDCVSFTTTVSARFWLMDCTNIPEATKMATELYREAIHVPFMAKFVVFSKRHQLEEARVRVFCMTDDKEDKTLETQEHFVEVAKSRDVEVLEGKYQYLEFAGNLIPVTKSGDQLAFNFYAFRENRLPFTVRVKDQNAESVGRVAFMRQPKVGRGDAPQSPICNLNLSLPDNIQPEPAPSEPDLLALEKKYAFLSISKAETIHKADLRLSDISNMLAGDWVALAKELEISDSDINIIKSQYPNNTPQQAIVMLRLWMQTSGNKATGNTLEKALRTIHRNDIVDECICNVQVVTDVSEKATAEEIVREAPPLIKKIEEDTPVKRIPSPESYEEKDLMKDAESADEDEIAQKIIPVPNGQEEEVSEMPIVPQPRSSTIQPTSQIVVESVEEVRKEVYEPVLVEHITKEKHSYELPSEDYVYSQSSEKQASEYIESSDDEGKNVVVEPIVEIVSREEDLSLDISVSQNIAGITIEEGKDFVSDGTEEQVSSIPEKKDASKESPVTSDAEEIEHEQASDSLSHSQVFKDDLYIEEPLINEEEKLHDIHMDVSIEPDVIPELAHERLSEHDSSLNAEPECLIEIHEASSDESQHEEAAVEHIEHDDSSAMEYSDHDSSAIERSKHDSSLNAQPEYQIEVHEASSESQPEEAAIEHSEHDSSLITEPKYQIEIHEASSDESQPDEAAIEHRKEEESEEHFFDNIASKMDSQFGASGEDISEEPVEFSEKAIIESSDVYVEKEAQELYIQEELQEEKQAEREEHYTDDELEEKFEIVKEKDIDSEKEVLFETEPYFQVSGNISDAAAELTEEKLKSDFIGELDSSLDKDYEVTYPDDEYANEFAVSDDQTNKLSIHEVQESELPYEKEHLHADTEVAYDVEFEHSQPGHIDVSDVSDQDVREDLNEDEYAHEEILKSDPFTSEREFTDSDLLEIHEDHDAFERLSSQKLVQDTPSLQEFESTQKTSYEEERDVLHLQDEPVDLMKESDPYSDNKELFESKSYQLEQESLIPSSEHFVDDNFSFGNKYFKEYDSEADEHHLLQESELKMEPEPEPEAVTEHGRSADSDEDRESPELVGEIDDSKLVSEIQEDLEEAVTQDGFTQPSAEKSQMVPGESAPSDVKPPVTAAGQPTSDLQLTEKEIGESRTAPKEASKAEASKTSSIMESDIAVLESIITTKEAEIREMSFSKTLAESQAHTQADKGDQEAQAQTDDGGQGFVTARPDTSKAKPDLTIKLKPNTTETKPDLPIKLKPKIQSSPPPPPPRTWPVTESDVKIPDAKTTTTTEVELSSDDDQLAIMKDSPRWEEEEIQAEDTADIRPIKVELKLMVKTTETGKESIEIRSIREFVDHNEEKPPDIHDGAEIPKNQLSSALQDSGKEEKVPITQHRISNDRCSTSPKFVRPKEKFPFFDEGTDDFNLMSQVRDIIAETEKERDISTHEDPPTKKKRSQKETNKQQKKP